jgi:IPT/TIG domain
VANASTLKTCASDLHRRSFLPPSAHERFARGKQALTLGALLGIALVLLTPSHAVLAQNVPSITTVDPLSGKVNDEITVTGANLGKASISAVFLSDEKTDYKAAIVEQSDTKIVMKVPQVKPGSYNVSFQKGNSIYIQPVRFTVE